MATDQNGEPMYDEPYPYQTGYGTTGMVPPNPPTSGMTIAGMVLGILSATIAAIGCCMPFIGGVALLTGVPAVAISGYGMSQIGRSMGALGGRGMAIAGIATGFAGCALGIIDVIFWAWIAKQA